jgi:hypothetical protein
MNMTEEEITEALKNLKLKTKNTGKFFNSSKNFMIIQQ